jgi:hypothetical protein
MSKLKARFNRKGSSRGMAINRARNVRRRNRARY